MSENQKNTRVKAPQKPIVQLPPKNPQFQPQNFKKPLFKGPSFSSNNAFRNQNRGSGGK
jgi:hypothetical protein